MVIDSFCSISCWTSCCAPMDFTIYMFSVTNDWSSLYAQGKLQRRWSLACLQVWKRTPFICIAYSWHLDHNNEKQVAIARVRKYEMQDICLASICKNNVRRQIIMNLIGVTLWRLACIQTYSHTRNFELNYKTLWTLRCTTRANSTSISKPQMLFECDQSQFVFKAQ